ncbi:MAG: helix-turn-helix domain-containing protein [Chthoniobacterales bacterium]
MANRAFWKGRRVFLTGHTGFKGSWLSLWLEALGAAGRSYSEIGKRLGCTDRYISLWKKRFLLERLVGLASRYRGAAHRRHTALTEARILELTRRKPTDGSTYWSSYRLAKEFGVSQSTVSRVWRQFGLQPHRSRSYMASGRSGV